MANIEDQPVMRRIKHVVDRHRKFDDAQSSAKMAAGHRDRIDRLGPQFIGELPQLGFCQFTDIGRKLDCIQ